jgi:hypothetical protein
LGGTRLELTQKNNFPEENATELVSKLKKQVFAKYSLSKVGQKHEGTVNGNQKFFEATY